jgi:hypothetical protein
VTGFGPKPGQYAAPEMSEHDETDGFAHSGQGAKHSDIPWYREHLQCRTRRKDTVSCFDISGLAYQCRFVFFACHKATAHPREATAQSPKAPFGQNIN